MSYALRLSIGFTACAAGACAESPSPSSLDGLAEPIESLAVVEVERTAPAAEAESRMVVRAAFARFRGVDGDLVLNLVGARAATDLETCRFAPNFELQLASPSARVDLLDAGPIEITAMGVTTRVMPKTFPELGDVVSGAFYAEDVLVGGAGGVGAQGGHRDERAEFVISTDGGQTPALSVAITEPAELHEVFVDGVGLSERVSARRGTDMELFWNAGDPRDRVVVELVALGKTVECVARDDGAFRIPADTTLLLDKDPAGRFEIRRVRTQPIDVGGIDVAWGVVATMRSAQLSVE